MFWLCCIIIHLSCKVFLLPAFSVDILNIHLLPNLFKRDIFDHTDFNNCLAISNLYCIFDVLEDLVLSTVSPYRTVDTLCDILIQSCYCPGIRLLFSMLVLICCFPSTKASYLYWLIFTSLGLCTLDHAIILKCLQTDVGFAATLLDFIVFDQSGTVCLPFNSGLPQCSVVGPILFTFSPTLCLLLLTHILLNTNHWLIACSY